MRWLELLVCLQCHHDFPKSYEWIFLTFGEGVWLHTGTNVLNFEWLPQTGGSAPLICLGSHKHSQKNWRQTDRYPFDSLFPKATWVSQHQKGETILDFKEAWDDGGGSGISWTTHKSYASRSRQITTPAPHHSICYRPDALSDAQPTVSKHWRQYSVPANWSIGLQTVFWCGSNLRHEWTKEKNHRP